MSTLMQTTQNLTVLTCWCGALFAVPESVINRRENGRDVVLFCPVNGHQGTWSATTALQQAKDEAVRERQRREQAEAAARDDRDRANRAERRAVAARGVVTRFKNKAKAGRCPCCSMTFKDLRDHMVQEHPKFEPEKAIDALAAKDAR